MTTPSDLPPPTSRNSYAAVNSMSGSFYSNPSLDSRRQSSLEVTAAVDCPNVLAKNAQFTGTIEVDDSLRLEGKFEGEVRTQGTLHVVPDATVQAKVQAAFVVIGGTFKGEVNCEQRVALHAQCRTQGRFVTNGLSVEEGALFDGEVVMTKKLPSSSTT